MDKRSPIINVLAGVLLLMNITFIGLKIYDRYQAKKLAGQGNRNKAEGKTI